jgi:N-hydroxyarylamine O-acetyltransferase
MVLAHSVSCGFYLRRGGTITHLCKDNLVPDHLPQQLVQRYLDLLRLSPTPPSLESLKALTSAHLTRIPFENISKLYRRKHFGLTGLPALEMYLDGIERYHFGGTCYANNYFLFQLLLTLGYQVRLCGADMSAPDVHLAIIATIDGREYLVDVGYAAPFFEPIPRNLPHDYEVALGRERFVLRPQDPLDNSRLNMYREGRLDHGYLLKPQPRTIDDFNGVICESMKPEATFMNAVLLVRQWPGRSVVIHNLTLIESEGAHYSKRQLASRDELIAEIQRRFEIPADIVREALSELPQLKSVWE